MKTAVSKMLELGFILRQLIAREGFMTFSGREGIWCL
jgi:hypothetical protein